MPVVYSVLVTCLQKHFGSDSQLLSSQVIADIVYCVVMF